MGEFRLPPNIHPSETLLLLRIPPNENTILKLFEHFKRYGRIQSIHSDGARTALITYASLESAEAAFKSAEAYAGNRLVQYRFPQDPAKVDSKLSSIVTWPKVNQALAQVSSEIASAQEHTARLQKDMKESHGPPRPPSGLSVAAMLEAFKAHRDDLVGEADRLVQQREESDEAQWPEIDARLKALEEQFGEVEESIAQLEAGKTQ
jgi:hypothetical protein